MNQFKEILSPLFNPNDLEDFLNHWSEEFTIKRNEFLVQKNDKKPDLYFVLEGAVRVYYENENEDMTVRLGYKNSFLMVLPPFINQEKGSDYYYQAIKKTTLISINRQTFNKILEKNSSLKNFWHTSIEQLILDQQEREIDLLISNPKERYERVLKRSPQVFQEIPNKYIASYLRMTPETLSRLQKS